MCVCVLREERRVGGKKSEEKSFDLDLERKKKRRDSQFLTLILPARRTTSLVSRPASLKGPRSPNRAACTTRHGPRNQSANQPRATDDENDEPRRSGGHASPPESASQNLLPLAPLALALLLCFARGARALPGEKGKELEIQSLEVGAERGFDCFNFAWHIPSLDLGPRLPLSRRLPSVPFQKLSLVAAGSFSLALSPSRRSAR